MSRSSYSEVVEDQYDALLRGLEEGLLLSINNSYSAGLPSDELRVEDSRDDKTWVDLSGPNNTHYRIHRDGRGELVYEKLTDGGLSHEDEVITIEVLGIDE